MRFSPRLTAIVLTLLTFMAPAARAAEFDAGKTLWADLQTGPTYGSAYDMGNFDGLFSAKRADLTNIDALVDVGVRRGFGWITLIAGGGAFARLGLADIKADPNLGNQIGYQLIPLAPMVAVDLLGKFRLQAHYFRWGSYTRRQASPNDGTTSYGPPVGGRLTFTRLAVFPPKGILRFNASFFAELIDYRRHEANGVSLADFTQAVRFITTGVTFGFDF